MFKFSNGVFHFLLKFFLGYFPITSWCFEFRISIVFLFFFSIILFLIFFIIFFLILFLVFFIIFLLIFLFIITLRRMNMSFFEFVKIRFLWFIFCDLFICFFDKFGKDWIVVGFLFIRWFLRRSCCCCSLDFLYEIFGFLYCFLRCWKIWWTQVMGIIRSWSKCIHTWDIFNMLETSWLLLHNI